MRSQASPRLALSARNLYVTLLVLWSAWVSQLIVSSGAVHDYEAYLTQWQHVNSGGDPWESSGIPINAYGPLHTAFAVLAEQGDFVPKTIFGFAFLALNAVLFQLILRQQPTVGTLVAYSILIPFNYLVIGVVFVFGNNDALVAALIGFAILARMRGLLISAGVLFGLAILLKYYPALLLPFLALDGRRIQWKVIAAASATVIFGLVITAAQWGESFASALLFGAGRGPSVLSLIAHLNYFGTPDVLMLPILRYNSLVVLMTVSVIFAVAWWKRLGWLESMTLAMLMMVATYKVGHQQFLLSWIVMLVALLVDGRRQRVRIVYFSLPLVLFLSGYQIVFEQYWLAGVFWDDEASIVREQMGIPFFVLAFGTFIASLALMWPGENEAKVSTRASSEGNSLKVRI